MGTKGLVYDDLATRASWAPHGTNAYYVGPAIKYYWCLRFYMPGTRQYWVADTLQLYLTHYSVPTLSPAEHTILEAMLTLTAPGGTVPTSTCASVARMQAIQKLCDILLPILHQSTSNPIATDMPSPRVLHPQLPPCQNQRCQR